ncbi:benzoylformate decarboxylase [Kibdelosporangium lantanae]
MGDQVLRRVPRGGQPGLTVRDAVRDVLAHREVEVVFGNPGSTEIGFLAHWPEAACTYVLGLQESVVVAMADGYAQMTGRPAVVNLHSAAGVGHAMGSIISAWHNRAPLVIIAGQQDRRLLARRPFLATENPELLPLPYAKWVHQPASAAEVPSAIAEAWHRAMQPPKGPTVVFVPADDWDQHIETLVAPRPPVASYGVDQETLSTLCDELARARRTVFVVGAAVDAGGAVEDLVALVEASGAQVLEAPMAARASFPEDHSQFAGFLKPSHQEIALALAEYDLVVVFGAPAFTEHYQPGWRFSGHYLTHCPLYVIHDDDGVLAWAPQGVALRADPAAVIRSLRTTVTPRTVENRPSPPRRDPPDAPEPGQLPTAGWIFHQLRDLMPSDALVVEEAPSHRPELHEHLPITARGSGFLTSAGGVLGYGLPAAVGAAIAQPERQVIAILGDGSAMYGVQALHTAARTTPNLKVIILDNRGYVAVDNHAHRLGAGIIPGTRLGGIDFPALARAQGCDSMALTSGEDAAPALAALLAAPGPTLLHTPVWSPVAPTAVVGADITRRSHP